MRIFIFTLFMAFFATPAFAQIEVGQTIPVIQSLPDQTGTERSFDDLKGEKGAIIVFYRSAGWCPYCQAQLIDLRNNKAEFEEAGYNLIGVSYDSVEKLAKFDTKRKVGFPLLSDKNSDLIRKFNLLDSSYKEGSFAYGVPKPAIFIVNNKGEVKTVLMEESFKKRPQVEEIMMALKAGGA